MNQVTRFERVKLPLFARLTKFHVSIVSRIIIIEILDCEIHEI